MTQFDPEFSALKQINPDKYWAWQVESFEFCFMNKTRSLKILVLNERQFLRLKNRALKFDSQFL